MEFFVCITVMRLLLLLSYVYSSAIGIKLLPYSYHHRSSAQPCRSTELPQASLGDAETPLVPLGPGPVSKFITLV